MENLLILADKLCLSRLVQICEHFLIKDLQQVVTASSILAQEFVDALSFSKVSYCLIRNELVLDGTFSLQN